MKSYIISGLFSLMSFVTAAQDDFKHNWDMKYLEHGIQFSASQIFRHDQIPANALLIFRSTTKKANNR